MLYDFYNDSTHNSLNQNLIFLFIVVIITVNVKFGVTQTILDQPCGKTMVIQCERDFWTFNSPSFLLSHLQWWVLFVLGFDFESSSAADQGSLSVSGASGGTSLPWRAQQLLPLDSIFFVLILLLV